MLRLAAGGGGYIGERALVMTICLTQNRNNIRWIRRSAGLVRKRISRKDKVVLYHPAFRLLPIKGSGLLCVAAIASTRVIDGQGSE
ncbi:hypothetical protein OUZ56_015363 [Daphnia magna]|uniref:Uncharacterized protein n=1 Tax=Daphnia magna TaxID=35525 RepID=A0ABR0AMP5_9CRUS|nr:hypothetical protein OUZ56_015363 [Daphnia magna]